VLLPYQNGRLAMTIVLPDGPLSNLWPLPSPGLLTVGATRPVDQSLPRFQVRSAFDLVSPLQGREMLRR
jgi:hypothetical protein